MTEKRASARSLRLLLRYIDARYLRRHYCEHFSCHKPTVLPHHHTTFGELVNKEWRS